MARVADTSSQAVPAHVAFDSSARRLEVTVDVLPADVADLTVAVGSRRIRIEADHPDGRYERSLAPPDPGRRFTDERRAVYNNGVLTVAVGTAPRDD